MGEAYFKFGELTNSLVSFSDVKAADLNYFIDYDEDEGQTQWMGMSATASTSSANSNHYGVLKPIEGKGLSYPRI